MDTYKLTKEDCLRIDILKFIGIVFVVYIHIYSTEANFSEGSTSLMLPHWLLLFENLVSQTIARCGVPMFFLISSVLLFRKPRDYKKTIFNKARTLLLPYLIWNSLWILVFILLQSFPSTASYFSGNKTPIMQGSVTDWLKLYGIGAGSPMDYPLWFMRDLMLVTILFPIIDKLTSRFPKQLLFVAAALLVIPIGFPLKQALLWVCAGACIVKAQIHLSILDNIAMWKILVFYVAGTLLALFANNSVIDALYIYLGLLFWIRVSKLIISHSRIKDILLKLSDWTFIIYVAHEMTLSSIKKVCLRLLPTEPLWLLAEYIFLPVIVICGCCLVGAILKKRIPKVYHVLTGSR